MVWLSPLKPPSSEWISFDFRYDVLTYQKNKVEMLLEFPLGHPIILCSIFFI